MPQEHKPPPPVPPEETNARVVFRAGSLAAPWLVSLLLLAGLGTFVLTRDDDPPPPPPVTTTTFPRDAYIEAISIALTRESHVALGEEGTRCIAGALVDTLGREGLDRLGDQPAPLASLDQQQREQVLRLVVTCVDPVVAEALLGGGTTTARERAGLPDEGG